MSSKVALIVIFNHRFDRNIEIIEKIYEGKFSNIFHIMPFYNGNKSNVIPVFEHSHRFNGYITQAFNHFYDTSFQHYLFVADDMILNPVINEHNYEEYLKLGPEDSFLSEIITLHERKSNNYWGRIKQAYEYNIINFGCEITNEIPTYDEALVLFKKAGLEIKPLNFDQIYHKEPLSLSLLSRKGGIKKYLRQIKHRNTKFNLRYPLAGGYSDIFAVSAVTIKQFARYCGIFAASNLFVEIAIPTAMVLSTPNIRVEADIELQGRALWSDEDFKILEPYANDLNKLLKDFPKNYLYLHPIKLSKWKTKKENSL